MPVAENINPEKVLRELRDLWVDLGKDQDAAGGVLRACAMTLVAVVEADSSDAAAVREIIGVLMHEHPSRAIVITPRLGAELSARVFSECWMPFGSRRQICAEGIEITADTEQTAELARLLVPLVAPDLPVILWCRGPRAFLDRTLDPLFPLANKIIFDTSAARHAPSAIEFLRRLRKDGRRVADLAWTRLTGWREAIAHRFDSPGTRVTEITAAVVTYGGERVGSSPLYLARWLEKALPGIAVRLQEEEGTVGIHAVTFAGPLLPRVIRFAATEVSEEVLLREELGLLERDAVFERVLA